MPPPTPPAPAPPPVPAQAARPPSQWDSPLGNAGEWLQGKAQDAVASAFDKAMESLWTATLTVLKTAFTLADRFSVFTVSPTHGPVSILLPIMLWISGVLALGLFFWQITSSVLRGGRGFMRVMTGPVQYGIALAVTFGAVATLLGAADGITNGILHYGLRANNFQDALNATGFLDAGQDAIKAVVLGLVALFGILPAALGYVLEMLFREAAIYVLVATVPISAAGLLAGSTAGWYWTSVRWMMAAIAMKPVLALVLVLGVAISGASQGLSGMLAGVGVLLISMLCPLVLFRLFSFVDPNSDAGTGLRQAWSQSGLAANGMEAISSGGDAGGQSGGGAQEAATADRFDEGMAETTGDGGGNDRGPNPQGEDDDSAGATSGAQEQDTGAQQPSPANRGQVVSSPRGDGDDPPDDDDDPPPPPPPPPGGGGPPGPAGGGGGGARSGASAGEAEEVAAVAV